MGWGTHPSITPDNLHNFVHLPRSIWHDQVWCESNVPSKCACSSSPWCLSRSDSCGEIQVNPTGGFTYRCSCMRDNKCFIFIWIFNAADRIWTCTGLSENQDSWPIRRLPHKPYITLAPTWLFICCPAVWWMSPAWWGLRHLAYFYGGHDGTWTHVTPLPVHYYRLISGLEHRVPNNHCLGCKDYRNVPIDHLSRIGFYPNRSCSTVHRPLCYMPISVFGAPPWYCPRRGNQPPDLQSGPSL